MKRLKPVFDVFIEVLKCANDLKLEVQNNVNGYFKKRKILLFNASNHIPQ